MIVVLSNSADVTADFMCTRLAKNQSRFMRLDTDRLIGGARFRLAMSAAELTFDGRALSPQQISCVYLRRPRTIQVGATDAAEGTHAAAEWAEALEGFLACVPRERWINHPAASAAASRKIEQLVRAARIGFTIPETLVTQSQAEAKAFLEVHENVIVKPLSGGYVERPTAGDDTIIYTARVLPEHLDRLALVERCPCLLQAEINKAFDVRVTAVDGRFSAVALRKKGSDGHQITDIRRDNWEGVEYQRIDLPSQVARHLSLMLAEYGLRFAAVDFAVDTSERWFFLEVNAGGQWAWLDMQAGTDIAGDLAWAMTRKS